MSQRELRLIDLKNVGPATLRDLEILGIRSVKNLANCDPTDLFQKLEVATGHRQDPCVWDVFAAIINQARTGKATSWWEWTPRRKLLQKSGELKHFY